MPSEEGYTSWPQGSLPLNRCSADDVGRDHLLIQPINES